MRLVPALGFALGIVTIALLAGCNGSSSHAAPFANDDAARSQDVRPSVARGATSVVAFPRADAPALGSTSWMNKAALAAPLLYVADFRQSKVVVFGRDGTVQGQITDVLNPQGMFVDHHRNLWVANTGNSNVLVFPRGATSPSRTLADPGFLPADVTVCPNNTVYVSNITSAAGGPGNIAVYAKGSTTPTGTLTAPSVAKGLFLTCDTKNNVFWGFADAGSGAHIVGFAGGSQSGESALPIVMGFPGGIKPNRAGNLLINDQDAHTVTEYTEAGVATGRAIATDPDADCVDISVSRYSEIVGCAIFTFSAPPGGHTYHFPGGKSIRLYADGLSQPLGIAFDPGQRGLGL